MNNELRRRGKASVLERTLHAQLEKMNKGLLFMMHFKFKEELVVMGKHAFT